MNTDTLPSKQINSEYPIISTDSNVYKALQLPIILTQEILKISTEKENINNYKMKQDLSKDALILSLKDENKHLHNKINQLEQEIELSKITSNAISDYVVALNREVDIINSALNEYYIPKDDINGKKLTLSARFKILAGRYIHGLQERINLLDMIGKQ